MVKLPSDEPSDAALPAAASAVGTDTVATAKVAAASP